MEHEILKRTNINYPFGLIFQKMIFPSAKFVLEDIFKRQFQKVTNLRKQKPKIRKVKISLQLTSNLLTRFC